MIVIHAITSLIRDKNAANRPLQARMRTIASTPVLACIMSLTQFWKRCAGLCGFIMLLSDCRRKTTCVVCQCVVREVSYTSNLHLGDPTSERSVIDTFSTESTHKMYTISILYWNAKLYKKIIFLNECFPLRYNHIIRWMLPLPKELRPTTQSAIRMNRLPKRPSLENVPLTMISCICHLR